MAIHRRIGKRPIGHYHHPGTAAAIVIDSKRSYNDVEEGI
jgi:hypothetical protein